MPNPNKPLLSDADAQAMTELASGRLAPLAALRLRARMARSPELAREFAETKALFTDLRKLRSERINQRPQPPQARHGLAAIPTQIAPPAPPHSSSARRRKIEASKKVRILL